MGEDAVIGVNPMEATDAVKEEPVAARKPPLVIKCGRCGWQQGMATAWRWDLCQLWVMCPQCGTPQMPLKDVPI